MQNAQNTEIQQRVINLVELYRTKVGKESQIAKEAKADDEYWLKKSIDIMEEEGLPAFGMYGEGPHTETWIKHLQVNEQLLGHFYAEVAGEAAEEYVLEQMQQDCYDNTVFSEEEESFLKAHFMEMVNYIVHTPCDDSLKWVNRGDDKNVYTIPQEVLELISSREEIAAGSKIFYPEAVFAQLSNLYQDSKFYFDSGYHRWLMFYSKFGDKYKGQDYGLYAWERIALYANKIDATFLDGSDMPSAYDAVVSYLPSSSLSSAVVEHLCKAYKGLPTGGKLLLLCPPELLAGKRQYSAKAKFEDVLAYGEDVSVKKELSEAEANEVAYASFRKMLVEDKSIKEIIQLPQVMSSQAWSDTYCLLVVEKGRMSNETVMIDARNAYSDMDSDHFSHVFDIEKFNAILLSEGKEPCTGLRKVVKIASDNLSVDLLIPQVYVVEKPAEAESPVPLSKLCELESTLIRDVQFDLPEDTPWISMSDLTPLFTGDLDMSAIRRADCSNNPPFVKGSKDYAFDKEGKFINSIFAQMYTAKGTQVLRYRKSFFIDGESDIVLYEYSDEQGVRVAVARATSKPYAVSKGILVFRPKDGVDANSLAAILRLPVVYRQLGAYQKFGIEHHLNDILVPTEKRVIGDEFFQMKKEKVILDDFAEKLANKEESLRLRKHALTQSLSSIKAMFVALNAYRKRADGQINDEDVISRIKGTTVQDAFEFINKGILEMMPALEHIADVEYTFQKAESLAPDEFIDAFIAKEEKGWLNFKPIITWKRGSRSSDRFIFPKDALEKVFENIISNAKAHAFNDDSRKDYQLKFSWHTNDTSLIIEIENNGTPIPEGISTASLMEYGVSTTLHYNGHNGIGCNEINSIMRKYNGKAEIVSTPKEFFTVKYVLTFNNILY